MAEVKTTQQQVREQFKVAENNFQSAFRAWNDVAAVTADVNLELAEKSLRYAQEARGQYDRVVQETLASYRRMQSEALKAWQSYFQSVNEIVYRSY